MKQLLKDFFTGLWFLIATSIIVLFTGLTAMMFPDIFGITVVVLFIIGIGKIVNYVTK